jgi:hypothetical protein
MTDINELIEKINEPDKIICQMNEYYTVGL